MSFKTKACVAVVFLVLSCLCARAEEHKTDSSCISCHEQLDGKLAAPVKMFKNDIHSEKQLSCQSCHGGDAASEDPEEAMSPEKGFKGAPGALEIPGFCARCHSDVDYMAKFNPRLAVDQLSKYRTSIHGKRSREGDTKVAQCVSCHGVHEIRPPVDPLSKVNDFNVPKTCAACHSNQEYMKEYNLPIDQFDKYSKSVHGVALLENKDAAAPACNDCHGNHGAAPPGVASVAFVCGNCHANIMELFNASPMKDAFTKLHLPGCETCHGHHDISKPTDAIVGVGAKSVCNKCHSATKLPNGYKVAMDMKNQLRRLSTMQAKADSIVHLADQKGMEVLDAQYKLHDVRQLLIESRNLVHSFDPARLKSKVDEGVAAANEASSMGEKAIADYYFRRKWVGISTLIISFLMLLLFLKIRFMEGRRRD